MKNLTIGLHTRAVGTFAVSVIDKLGREVESHVPQRNLILDQGMDILATESWFNAFRWAAAGTGTTPTKVAVDGTASQSGTTVTLAGSSYSFVSGDVGSWLKWSSGEEAKITAFTNSTTVTVSPSQTVSSGTLVGLFRCGQTALDTEIVRVGGDVSDTNVFPEYTDGGGRWSQGFFPDDSTGIIDMVRTFDFPEEVGSVTYNEVGAAYSATNPGNLFSRVLLSSPVTVTAGRRLRVRYTLSLTVPYAVSPRPVNTTVSVSGWPYAYSGSIVSTVSDFTVTTSENHHYLAGGTINILGATNPGYDGEWLIDSVTANTIVVLSASNLGAATGIVQANLKADFYLQRWNVSANPSGGGN